MSGVRSQIVRRSRWLHTMNGFIGRFMWPGLCFFVWKQLKLNSINKQNILPNLKIKKINYYHIICHTINVNLYNYRYANEQLKYIVLIAYGMVINYKRPAAPHSDTAYTTSIFVMTRLSIFHKLLLILELSIANPKPWTSACNQFPNKILISSRGVAQANNVLYSIWCGD